MTLLRDLIHIPDRVHKGDFVLKLTEGVGDADATLRHYVVTERLPDAFDRALQLIESAVAEGTSKATYLHGSFGSGKSHFMAVLYLLLQQVPAARAIPELSAVVAKHDAWLAGKNFLLVPFHLIGAKNLAAAVLGGYAQHLRRLHPEAPTPSIYVAESILANADQLRATFGDAQFFARLSEGDGTTSPGWGAQAAGWDAARYEQARQQPPESDACRQLVDQLLSTFFPAYEVQADASGGGFVSMDAGLAEISRHAADLGYQGIVLFLDELILWLAGRAGDPAFVEQQIEAVVKLVEAQRSDRPVPIVSFVARQRDLRELIGTHMPGADRLRYIDKLDHNKGRFGSIDLETRNLMTIVEKRLLTPKDADARQRIDAAFQALRARPEVIDTLLASHDQRTFRAVYPFNPAMIEALTAVSSVLQRERTALKLLSELLVTRRDQLQVGDLVPFGDLWEVLVSGGETFDQAIGEVFDQAKKLWRTKLRPILEGEHQLAPGEEPPPEHPFHGDTRLLQTLLIAALAPETPELRSLTVSRLVALNHGSIRSPIPGQEVGLAASKLRRWVGEGAGEIHIGEDADPTLSVELTGVDVESILSRVQAEDNPGNRARKVRELLYTAMEIPETDNLLCERRVLFKGTKRRMEVIFGNVREHADDRFQTGERWKLMIDFPFDHEGYTPSDDIARLEALPQDIPQRVVCWLPHFFSSKGRAELGRLVCLDFLLAGERFAQYADHLPPTERQSARALLRNQQTQLRERLRQALEVAYGIRDGQSALVDSSLPLEDHLRSLDHSFRPKPPVANNFKEAFEGLATRALDHQFPARPNLGPDEVRKADLIKVCRAVFETLEAPDRRLRIQDTRLRSPLKRFVEPLRLGEVVGDDTYLTLDDHWIRHFENQAARDAADRSETDPEDQHGEEVPISVGQLRTFFDHPSPMGLERWIQDLLILVFAHRTHRTFALHNGPAFTPELGDKLDDVLTLHTQAMPSEDSWLRACGRAHILFGVQPLSSLLSANSMTDLATRIHSAASGARPGCEALVLALVRRCKALGITGGQRLEVARDALRLLSALEADEAPLELLRRLVDFDPSSSPEAVARTAKKADTLLPLLDDSELWTLFDSVWSLGDERRTAAEALRQRVEDVLRHDELALPAAAELRRLRAEAVDLLAATPTPNADTARPSVESVGPAPSVAQGTGWVTVAQGQGSFSSGDGAREALERALGAVEKSVSEGVELDLELRWILRTPLREDGE